MGGHFLIHVYSHKLNAKCKQNHDKQAGHLFITTCTARVLLFSVVFVCWSVCECYNYCTIRDIITKFSGHHLMVKRVKKFENGYTEVHGWWFNVSDILFQIKNAHKDIKNNNTSTNSGTFNACKDICLYPLFRERAVPSSLFAPRITNRSILQE